MKLKILALDDEVEALAMIRDHFSIRGYEVATATGGKEGVELCRRVKPDVILVDLKMNEMDGDEAVPLLRSISPKAKIYMVSAYQDDKSSNRLTGLAIDGFFEKPVSIRKLQQTIESAFANRS